MFFHWKFRTYWILFPLELFEFVSPVLTISRYDFLPNQRNILDLGFWIYNRVLNNEFTTIEYATRLIVTCMFLYVISHHISVCVTFEPWSIVYGLWQSWSCIDGNPEIWMLWMLGKLPLKQWSYDHPLWVNIIQLSWHKWIQKGPIQNRRFPSQKKNIKYWLVKNGIPLIIIGYVRHESPVNQVVSCYIKLSKRGIMGLSSIYPNSNPLILHQT